ncbi:deoxyribonuclease V [Salinisphaera sp. Q1T1-3]|uniref:deoxyribonuclease V n=1 Tax=Salinisphaera sp. Q1T1-3 TaxID=2321229 RepID=UPI001EEB71D2|nr:deoxyribonuclease V [Salinisphaera sp. Q1T1-3]
MPKTTRNSTPALETGYGPHGLIRVRHDWPSHAADGRALQERLREYIDAGPLAHPIRRVAGVDIGFEDRGATTRAAIVVLDAETGAEYERALVREPTRMPYIPGLLSFREVPAALTALARLEMTPDLLMVDGHGIAHPRRLGVATHLGLASGLPAIGIAKKRLVGTHDTVPDTRFAQVAVTHAHETIGVVLRSRVRVKPIYVSRGHGCTLDEAVMWCKRMLSRYRLPETTRAADRLASNR